MEERRRGPSLEDGEGKRRKRESQFFCFPPQIR